MTLAPPLAGAAAVAAVLGAWELAAAAEVSVLGARLARVLEPLGRARREGREPSRPERRRLAVLAAGCLLAAGWLLAGPLAGIGAALAGPVAMVAYVRTRAARYRDDLASGAAPAARALADAVGAGRSVRGSVAEAARGVSGAAGRELAMAARELALGAPTAVVLDRVRIRARCPAWDTVVTAVLLQREAGGDLPALLRDLAAALEAADRAARDARTATAQARFTARLVLGLPLAAAALAELGSPGFTASLLGDPFSATLTALAVMLQITSLVAIRRIAP